MRQYVVLSLRGHEVPSHLRAGDSEGEVEIRQVFEMDDFAPIVYEEQIRYKMAKRAELPHQTANK
jgi:hypothetical protein